MFLWFRRGGKHGILAVPTCRILYRTWSHAWKEERKHLGLAVNNSSFSLTFIRYAVLPTDTRPCHRHILPWNRPVRCTCSRPACCVYSRGASWYHLSNTQPVRDSRSSIHLVPTWFVCCFSFNNNSLAILLSRKI